MYFGDLGETLANAKGALQPGGWFLFTVEKGEDSGQGYALMPHGRYSHGNSYLEASLQDAGLELVEISEKVLRKEMQEPVAGWLVAARNN